MKFRREIIFGDKDMRGAITFALSVVALAIIFIVDKMQRETEIVESLNSSDSVTLMIAQHRDLQAERSGWSKSSSERAIDERNERANWTTNEKWNGTTNGAANGTANGAANRTAKESVNAEAKREPTKPFDFDPNTVQLKELLSLGFTKGQALSLLRYRAAGKVFRIREELISCHEMSDSLYFAIEPYIVIGEEFRYKPREYQSTPNSEPTSSEGISTKKALIDLNNADSTALVAVYGIGAKSAAAIIEYRERLGGFHSKEQLSEIKIITESNFEKIIEQIFVNYSDISKIDVNFATAKQLGQHPYFTPLKIRRLLKIRELKGGWRSTEEMIEDDIFTKEEAQRVHPYLHFEVLNPL